MTEPHINPSPESTLNSIGTEPSSKPKKPLSKKSLSRTITIWILGLGGVVILLLLVALFFISNKLKNNLQDTLNTQLQAMQEAGANLSYEPFSCSGLRAITCSSKAITWENLTLESVQLGVESFSDSGATIELKSGGVKIANLKSLQELARIDLISMINPNTLQCRLALNTSAYDEASTPENSENLKSAANADDTANAPMVNKSALDSAPTLSPAISPALAHDLSCVAKASNLSYSWGASGYIALDESLQGASFPQILRELASAYMNDRANFLAQTPIFIERAHLQSTADNLPQAIIRELAKAQALEQSERNPHAPSTESTQATPSELESSVQDSPADSSATSASPESSSLDSGSLESSPIAAESSQDSHADSSAPAAPAQSTASTLEPGSAEYDALYAQFASTLETIKPLALYIALLNLREKEHIALVEFSINALSDMYLGKNGGISYEITPKEHTALSLESLLYDPLALLKDTNITYQALPTQK